MIYVRDIIRICNGLLYSGNDDMECVNFTKDTRTLNTGDIYVGIKGEVFNGNDFYKEAFDKGASVCILDRDTVIDDKYKKYTIVLDISTKGVPKQENVKKKKRRMKHGKR